MIKLEDIKPGIILYCINTNEDNPIIEEFKVKSILRKNNILTFDYEKFYVLTLTNKHNEIRYIKIKIYVYNNNRENFYLGRYQIFHNKNCKITYIDNPENQFIKDPVYEDELNKYVISFEKDYLIDNYIHEQEKHLYISEHELENTKKEIERYKRLIDNLKKL